MDTNYDKLEQVDISSEMRTSFLDYSMSVIVQRALPDVRDGLKPVHRRILHSMNTLGITANVAHKKSARIVGEVIGKYHPHGDTAVYDAMVRMAQDFSYRYPLVDGHGNFGSMDGDGAAAMRYTEARMSKIAMELMKDIQKDTVDFRDNYDGEEKEPSYMHSGEEQEELKDKWKDLSERILVDLQTSSKEWGERSDTMLQGVKKINRDKYDYSTFLRKFATMREDIQINPEEFDYVYYTFGMERYGNIPLIEPLEYKEVRKVRDFVIAIDTSGSCAGEVVQKFLDKTYSLFTQQENFFKKINLHIIQCDAQIQSDVKITSREEFDDYVRDLEFKGFGGTDFRPVFEYVNEMIEQREFDDLKGLIYFTDGNGTYPKKRPPYETAFVFVDDDEFEYEVPGWAMKLVLETSDIMQEVLI